MLVHCQLHTTNNQRATLGLCIDRRGKPVTLAVILATQGDVTASNKPPDTLGKGEAWNRLRMIITAGGMVGHGDVMAFRMPIRSNMSSRRRQAAAIAWSRLAGSTMMGCSLNEDGGRGDRDMVPVSRPDRALTDCQVDRSCPSSSTRNWLADSYADMKRNWIWAIGNLFALPWRGTVEKGLIPLQGPQMPATMDNRIQRIQEKIKRSNIKLWPPLTERAIVAFEQKRGISLPEGYRRFLLEVGDGGEGPPHYGLVPLGRELKLPFRPQFMRGWRRLPFVKVPFPFTRGFVWEDGDLSDEVGHEQSVYGNIFLGTNGCGLNWHVIVTGPARGNVWQFCDGGIAPTDPKRGFLEWYEDWLDGLKS
jgi:hypothetical protein